MAEEKKVLGDLKSFLKSLREIEDPSDKPSEPIEYSSPQTEEGGNCND